MIPVPPFADADEAQLFVRQLAMHIAAMDGERVTLPTFTLLTVLEESAASLRRRRPDDTGEIRLPYSVLRCAVLTRFPAPWTPQGLHTAIGAGDAWAGTAPTRHTRLGRGSDPIITGILGHDGLWTVTCDERGTTTTLHEGLDDDAYVQVMLDDARGHAFPYGWKSDDLPDHDRLIRGGLDTAWQWNTQDGALPFLTNWIAERDAALPHPDAP